MEAFEEAIKERVGGFGEVPDELIGTAAYQWFEVTPGLDVAKAWWDAGVNPLDGRFTDLLRAGARPKVWPSWSTARPYWSTFGRDYQRMGPGVTSGFPRAL